MRFAAADLEGLVFKEISGGEVILCDGNCHKAWGINNRPSVAFSDDPDDIAYLADGELGIAPDDPGTYEGGHAKPDASAGPGRQNKWCYRECERSISIARSESFRRPHDFTGRLYNLESRRIAEGQ